MARVAKVVAMIVVAHLVIAAATLESGSGVGSHHLSPRRLLFLDNYCSDPYVACCTNCGLDWMARCCDPDNYFCGLDFLTGTGSGNVETCMPRCHQLGDPSFGNCP
ncbi:hypothetical protein SEVIR_8G047600v4 [Setaria viridis]